jgi:hypothetical protein
VRLHEKQTRRLHRQSPGAPGLCPRGEGQSEVALGSGRSCANRTAVPDVTMIETALAGGTVAREIICAGLSEHRTTVGYSAAEFTKGCVWGAAGSENLPAAWQGWHSGRKERLRANPQTMDRDPDRGCRLSRHKRRRKQRTTNHPHWRGLVGSAPQTPRDLSLWYQSRRDTTETGRRSASRLRSWSLARRSGRVSAWPCPPVRSWIILSATPARNHCRCARCPQPAAANSPHWRPRARVGGGPFSVSAGTCPESNRPFRVRYTRSWAVVFGRPVHFLVSSPLRDRS